MVTDWQDLVERTLLLPTYSTEQDIKDALRYKYGSGNVVRERRITIWFEWLVRLDELRQRNKLLGAWSGLWHIALEKGVSVQAIEYDVGLDVIRERIVELRNKLNLPF